MESQFGKGLIKTQKWDLDLLSKGRPCIPKIIDKDSHKIRRSIAATESLGIQCFFSTIGSQAPTIKAISPLK